MKLLFIPEARDRDPNGREVLLTWVVWVPVTVLCFYVAWAYAASGAQSILTRGLETVLVVAGAGTVVRPVSKTGRWLKKEAGE